MYLSQKIESQDTLRKYEYIKKDIRNVKEDLHKGFRVAKNIKHF